LLFSVAQQTKQGLGRLVFEVSRYAVRYKHTHTQTHTHSMTFLNSHQGVAAAAK